MSLVILNKHDLMDFVAKLLTCYRVAGPVRKNNGFAFDFIHQPETLQLDYPTTILPPKKFLFPIKETLFEFEDAKNGSICPPAPQPPTVIFGVHSCDMHAIQLLDHVFSTGYVDPYYTQRRSQTVLISIECLTPCDQHSFCKSMGTLSAGEGYDLHMVDLGDVYAIDVLTETGLEVLHYARVVNATSADIERLNAVMSEKWPRFPYRLDFDISDLPSLMKMSVKSPLWAELGERCLSCAACTNVCPTCFCFDVKDEISLDLQGGKRVRTWDSCQLDEFARVAGGHDFRKSRAQHQRHRFMRKGRYILETHKYLGCVGCGRCARACLVDITPVGVFNELYRQSKSGGQA